MSHSTNPRKKPTLFDVAFAVVLFLFFVVSVFTCGNFQSTGASATIQNGENYLAVFDVKGTTKATLQSVYLNVGHVSLNDGEELFINIKTSTSKTTKPQNSFGQDAKQKSDGVKVTVGENGNYLPYNWLEVLSDKPRDAASLSIKANLPFVLHEIVAVDSNGNVVPLSVNKTLTKEYVHPVDTLGGAVDAKNSFSASTSARYRYTKAESDMMTAIDNMLLGKTYVEGFVYHANTGAGALATAIYLPSVAIFGHSVGALRLTSVIFTTLALIFAYSFIKLLTKSDKNGFIAVTLLVLSSLPFTVGRLGTPSAIVFCALVGAAYYMLRFFSQGVRNEKVRTDSLPVLYAGLLSAVAIAINLSSAFPVLGICTLFVFGLKRQALAHALALSTMGEADEDVLSKEKSLYSYKQKTVCGYAALSFIVGTFVAILLGGVVGYNSLVRAYDDPSSPRLGFMSLLFKSTSAVQFGVSNPFALFMPFARLQLLQSGEMYFTAFINPVVLIAALCGFLYTATACFISLVKKQSDKASKRLKRIFLILLGCTVTALLQAAFTKELSLLCALPCSLSIISFIPLAYNQLEKCGKHGKLVADIALCTIISLSAVFFLFTLSQTFGGAKALFILLH